MTKENVVPIQDLEWTEKLVNVLQAFRDVNPDISANQMLTLLLVHREPGVSQTTLADKDHLDRSSGTVTRICAVLSDRGNRGTPGLGLIEIGHAPGDYRTTSQTVSAKGRRILGVVRKIMER